MEKNINRKALFEIHLNLLEPFKGKAEFMVIADNALEACIKITGFLATNYQIKVDSEKLEITQRWFLADNETEIFY